MSSRRLSRRRARARRAPATRGPLRGGWDGCVCFLLILPLPPVNLAAVLERGAAAPARRAGLELISPPEIIHLTCSRSLTGPYLRSPIGVRQRYAWLPRAPAINT
ncbi:hypothetical protein AAFF_G00082280 [Aldrovandia affinis]|uniref:Uncharacterized protein n=1 Tax=Aldrovandia affinis TaxID=143900 RepID=A0AAD7T5A5_9TELE|nr:hypothetical protein AAFF_G00082280 [Aldrovandia affinis]